MPSELYLACYRKDEATVRRLLMALPDGQREAALNRKEPDLRATMKLFGDDLFDGGFFLYSADTPRGLDSDWADLQLRHVRDLEAKACREADEKARREAEEKSRREADEKARREAEAKARREAEEKARRDAEEKARREAEEKARREAEEKARREAEEKARPELAAAKQKAEFGGGAKNTAPATTRVAEIYNAIKNALDPEALLSVLTRFRASPLWSETVQDAFEHQSEKLFLPMISAAETPFELGPLIDEHKSTPLWTTAVSAAAERRRAQLKSGAASPHGSSAGPTGLSHSAVPAMQPARADPQAAPAHNDVRAAASRAGLLQMSDLRITADELGAGSYKRVLRAVWTTGGYLPVAVAQLTFPANVTPAERLENLQQFRQEIDVMLAFSHPHIVTIHGAVVDPKLGDMLVMELMQGGSLESVLHTPGTLHKPTLLQRLTVLRQITSALLYLHSKNTAHFDIKSANVLLSAPFSAGGAVVAKLTDFGLARTRSVHASTLKTMTALGTATYMAPEMFFDTTDDDAGAKSLAADLWSLGCLIYETGCCKYPHHELPKAQQNFLRLQRLVGMEGKPPRCADIVGNDYQPLCEMVAGLCVKEPAARLHLGDVLTALDAALNANGAV